MKKIFLASALLSASLFLSLNSSAQNDSSHYDLGQVRIKKSFTQAITVKGADLEKIPTTNLSNALNVWFYGLYTDGLTTVYVIDGNLINDINAYSIQDIEEVSLIQNALIQLNGAYRYVQLVVVTTIRQHNTQSGLSASAMANVVGRSHGSTSQSGDDNLTSTTDLYQNYNLSGFVTTGKGRFGLSGNYQHDGQPSIFDLSQGNKTNDSDPRFHRIRFFGYAEQQLLAGTTAGVKINYATQKSTFNNGNLINVGYSLTQFKINQQMFNGEAYVTSNIYKNLKNHVSFTYNQSTPKQSFFALTQYGNQSGIDSSKNHQILLRDNLSYNLKAGNFEFEPALNLTYRRNNDTVYSSAAMANSGMVYNASWYTASQLTLTPSANISYKDFFGLQGGFTRILKTRLKNGSSSSTDNSVDLHNKTLPFVNGSINTTNLLKDLKVSAYGSYSQFVATIDGTSPLYDPNNNDGDYDGLALIPLFNNYVAGNFLSDEKYHAIVLGTKIDLLRNRLSLNYNYEKRNYRLGLQMTDPYGHVGFYSPDFRLLSHRIEAAVKVLNAEKLRWISKLNASHILTTLSEINPQFSSVAVAGKNLWTGGWANRLTAGNYFAGLDMLFLFSNQANYSYPVTVRHLKPFSLQNIFVGYTFKSPPVKQLQVFINARNLIQTTNSALTDERYFIGGGINASL